MDIRTISMIKISKIIILLQIYNKYITLQNDFTNNFHTSNIRSGIILSIILWFSSNHAIFLCFTLHRIRILVDKPANLCIVYTLCSINMFYFGTNIWNVFIHFQEITMLVVISPNCCCNQDKWCHIVKQN